MALVQAADVVGVPLEETAGWAANSLVQVAAGDLESDFAAHPIATLLTWAHALRRLAG